MPCFSLAFADGILLSTKTPPAKGQFDQKLWDFIATYSVLDFGGFKGVVGLVDVRGFMYIYATLSKHCCAVCWPRSDPQRAHPMNIHPQCVTGSGLDSTILSPQLLQAASRRQDEDTESEDSSPRISHGFNSIFSERQEPLFHPSCTLQQLGALPRRMNEQVASRVLGLPRSEPAAASNHATVLVMLVQSTLARNSNGSSCSCDVQHSRSHPRPKP